MPAVMPPYRQQQRIVRERLPDNLFRTPIDYLAADHYRQLALCRFLEHVAVPKPRISAREAETVLIHLRHDLPQHAKDEDESLAPRLALRSRAGDDIDSVLRALGEAHRRDRELAAALVDSLRRTAAGEGGSVDDVLAREATAFIEHLRDHLAWEEKVVLPLARRRLRGEDFSAIGREMATRRDLPFPD